MNIIKYWFKIYQKEDLSFFKYIALLLLLGASFVLGGHGGLGEARGFAFLFFGCMYLSFQIATIHERYHVMPLLLTANFSTRQKHACSLLVALLANLPLLLAQMVYMFIFFQFSLASILFSLLMYVYGNLLGQFFGVATKHMITGLSILLVIFLLILTMSDMMQELFLRYLSPILQLNNFEEIHFVNIAGIVFVTILISIVLLKGISDKKRLATTVYSASLLFFAGLYAYEYTQERNLQSKPYRYLVNDSLDVRYRGVSSEYAEFLGGMVHDIQVRLLQYQLIEYVRPITVVRVYFAPGERIPFLIYDGRIVIKCFTHSMLNMNTFEIFQRTILTIFRPQSLHQDALLNILQTMIKHEISTENSRGSFYYQDIARAEHAYYNTRLHLIGYSQITSPRWTFFTEIVFNHINYFNDVYKLAQTHEGNISDFLERVEEHILEQHSPINSIIEKIREAL